MLVGLFCLNTEVFAGEARQVWTSFRQEDGLAHNVVTAVVQTPDGAMWFATRGGVSRYDGRSWEKFGVEDGLPGNAVQDLVAAPDGALWAAVGRGFDRQARQGMAYFSGERWIGIDTPEEFRGRGGLRQILGLEGGRACLVTDEGRLLRFDGAQLYVVTLDGQPLQGVQSLMADANGKVWVAYGGRGGNVLSVPGMEPGGRGRRGGLRGADGSDGGRGRGEPGGRSRRGGFRGADDSDSRGGRGGRPLVPGTRQAGGRPGGFAQDLGLLDVDTGEWTTIADMDSLNDVSVWAMAQSGDGALWFGTNESGLKRYDSGRWETFTTEDGLPSNRVQVISFAQDGTVWIGTPAGAASRDANGQWRTFAEREGLPNSDVVDICIAADGAIWVGTRGGVARLGLSGWIHHRSWPGMNDRGASIFALDDSGQLWVGNDAIYKFENGSWQVARALEDDVRGRLIDLFVDGKGSLWAVTQFQLLRYDGALWEVINLDRRMGLGLPFRDVCPAQDGGVWAIMRSGVHQFDGQAWTVLSTSQDLVQEAINPRGLGISICEASDGSLWLGRMDGVVHVVDGEQRKYTAADGIPGGPITAVAEDIGGRIWVSSPLEGVAYFNGQRWRRVPGGDQAQFNGIRRIFPANDGTVWLASWIDGAIRTDGLAWVRYTVQEGLLSTQVWDVAQDAEGNLWFATSDGLGCYNPDGDAPETLLLAPPVQIAPYQNALFEFAGQDVWKQTPDGSLQYSWRLDAGAWSGFSRNNRVLLEDLDAGAHKFEVRAMDLAFNVDKTSAVQVFEVLAPVWQRPWFVGLSGVSLLIVLVTTGYAFQKHKRWRVAQTRLIDELETELQEAHDMQMGLLPRDPVREKGFEVVGRCLPANHVGGDYFTYFWLDDDRKTLGFGAADVSGKAMQGAVRAMQLSGMLHYEVRAAKAPIDVLRNLHIVLQEQFDAASFVTCCLGTLDLETGAIVLANAGHPFPYRVSADGGLCMVELMSVPLGMTLPPEVDTEPKETRMFLDFGDMLVLYSDGVTDMQNATGEFYEEARLEALLKEHAGASADALIDTVIDDLVRFRASAAQTDDVTLLVIKRQ